MPRKKRAAVDEEAEDDQAKTKEEQQDLIEEPKEEEKPKKRARKKKEETVAEKPHEAHEGPKWMIHPPWMMYKEDESPASTKIAAFDLDGTLIAQKSNQRFATSASDWKLYNERVPKVLQDFVDDGFRVVIFSNQGGIGKQLDGKQSVKLRERATQAFEKIDVPATIMYATGKEGCGVRKPETGMWDFFVARLNCGVQPDKDESFFVGDASGRPGDFADSDKMFAENIGIAYKTPEEVFGDGPKKAFSPSKEKGPNHNPELGAAFDQLATKFAGDRFKGSAFKKVAEIINGYNEKITSGKQLGHVKGVGKSSVQKIDEFLTTGTITELEDVGGVQAPAAAAGNLPADAKMAVNFL